MTINTLPVAIITGAGSGIGREAAKRLARAGYALALVGRRMEALEETISLLPTDDGPPTAIGIAADVADPDDCSDVIDAAAERFGRIDALVNNAGFAPLALVGETTPELLERVFAVNALGPGRLIAGVWPWLTRQGGCIVNVSTLGAADPFPGFFAYAAAKAAVNVMAKSCAKEGKPHNVRAFAVAPAAVETHMLRQNFDTQRIPPELCLSPDEVAALIVDCIRGRHDNRNGDTLWIEKEKGVW